MRPSGWIATALMLCMTGVPIAAQELPLPEKIDIPGDVAKILCPDAAAGQRMIADYLLPSPSYIDPVAFKSGAAATGCDYGGDGIGPIAIEAVIARKTVQPGTTFILYRGTTEQGAQLIGLADEELNNRYPRNPFDRWLWNYTADGVLSLEDGPRPAFACKEPAAVIAIIEAMEAHDDAEQQSAALEAALSQYDCLVAAGDFQITAVHNDVSIYGEYGVEKQWTALSATDSSGRSVGLLYDLAIQIGE